MADQGSIAHDANQLSEGIIGPLFTHDSIAGANDANQLSEGIIGPLFTHDSISGAHDANQLSEGYIKFSIFIAWYKA